MTNRQAQILTAIVEAYAEVGYPIGSVTLAKLFQAASSTIRSEMSILEDLDYIYQPHTSAGRVPTDKGYRWYVNNLQSPTVDTKNADLSNQVKVLSARIEGAGEAEQAIKSAVDSLVELTANVGIGTLGSSLHISGLGNLFSQPEFTSKASIQAAAYLLDNLEAWLHEVRPNQSPTVLIGQENPIGKTSGCSLIISRFQSPYSDRSYVGVIGSTRQNYRQIMTLVKSAGEILEESFEDF
ncbi:MAG: transcriptional regulator [Candidatus Saccharibacteria bacterium]|nr:transcriptional regulator [Candidatus Saccharibacteria bacterium]